MCSKNYLTWQIIWRVKNCRNQAVGEPLFFDFFLFRPLESPMLTVKQLFRRLQWSAALLDEPPLIHVSRFWLPRSSPTRPQSLSVLQTKMVATVTCCLIRHLPGFPITVIRPIPKTLVYRNFSKKIKGKRQKVIKDNVDIEGILRSSSAASTTKPAIEIAATNDSPKDREIKTWQTSEERTNLLKQGERRLALQSQFKG